MEETGWKLVHGDVFRPPQYPMLLVACIGSGLQLLCMVLVIIGTSCTKIGCIILIFKQGVSQSLKYRIALFIDGENIDRFDA